MYKNNNFPNSPDPHLEPELDPMTLGMIHSAYLHGYAREGFAQAYDYMSGIPTETVPEFSLETIFGGGGVYEVLRRTYINPHRGYLDVEFTKMPHGDMAAYRYHRIGGHVMRLPLTLAEAREELHDLGAANTRDREALESWDPRDKTKPRLPVRPPTGIANVLPRQRTLREKVGVLTRRSLLRLGLM